MPGYLFLLSFRHCCYSILDVCVCVCVCVCVFYSMHFNCGFWDPSAAPGPRTGGRPGPRPVGPPPAPAGTSSLRFYKHIPLYIIKKNKVLFRPIYCASPFLGPPAVFYPHLLYGFIQFYIYAFSCFILLFVFLFFYFIYLYFLINKNNNNKNI